MKPPSGESRETLITSLARIRGRLTTLATVTGSGTDVKQSLGELNAIVSGVLESLSDGYLLLDKELVVLSFNFAAERLLHRPSADVVGRPLLEAFPEARGSVFEAQYLKALAGGEPASFTHYFETAPYAGWYEVRVFPCPRGIEVFFRITTERHKAEDALLESVEGTRNLVRELRALVEATRKVLGDAFEPFEKTARMLFDQCRSYIGARAGYVALLGGRGLVFVESGGMACTVPRSLPMRICDPLGRPLVGAEPVFDNSFSQSAMHGFLPSGHMALENILLAPLVVEGKVEGVLGLANKEGGFTDEDARMGRSFADLAALALQKNRSWEAQRQSAEVSRALFDAIGDAVYIYDFNGRLLDANPQAWQRLGQTRTGLLALTLQNIRTAASARMIPLHLELMRRDGRATFETEHRHVDGTVLSVEVNASTLSYGGSPAVLAVVRDISHRKDPSGTGPRAL